MWFHVIQYTEYYEKNNLNECTAEQNMNNQKTLAQKNEVVKITGGDWNMEKI